MADWGTGSWGVSDWGGALGAAGTNAPQIVSRLPVPGARDVAENSVITIRFYDPDYDLNTQTTIIVINDQVAFLGNLGAQTGFVARTSYNAGALIVQVAPVAGFEFGAVVKVRAFISDMTLRSADDTWTWTVRSNPVCYSGLTPLPIELAIQQPMTTFLELEPLRQLLLRGALDTEQTRAPANEGNKAARVVYQWAFETELSTVLNPYRLRNEPALTTVVCERKNIAKVDHDIQAVKMRVQAAITSLYSLRALPKEYTTGFMDYLDSTVYSYRVSLVANMVLLARAVEQAAGPSA